MSDRHDNWPVIGLMLLLPVGAGLWWLLGSRPPVGPGWQSSSSFTVIALPADTTLAAVHTMARASGYVALTNTEFNTLLPPENRSSNFIGAAVYRYTTSATNDDRLLAVPSRGNNCYFFFRCQGDGTHVQRSEREVERFIRKLEKKKSNGS